MFNIKIADLVITIDNKYPLLEEKCADYITNEENDTGIVLQASDDRIEYSIKYKEKFDGEIIDRPYAEYDAIHYTLYKELHNFDAFWLHSVLIEKDGCGYAFSANPGVGKSTHAALWLKAFKDARIINGDNTIIRLDKNSGTFYGYGTPFCGKEGYQTNKKVKIVAVSFLERSDTNYVEKMDVGEAANRMREANFCKPTEGLDYWKSLALNVQFAGRTNFYTIHCNMNEDAAITAYNEIKVK